MHGGIYHAVLLMVPTSTLNNYATYRPIQGVLLLRCLAGDMALPPAQPEQAKPTIYA